MGIFGMGGSEKMEVRVEATGTEKFAAEMGASAASVTKFDKIVAGVGVGAAVGIGAALAGSVKEAAKFQDAMIQVQKVTNAKTMREMSGEIRKMARTIPLAQTELAKIAEAAGQFGITGSKNIASFTESVAKMVNATDLTADQAGEAFAKLTTLTGMPIGEVENLGSAINALSNTAAASSSEIVGSMMRAAGTFAQAGMSATEIAAISTTLNEVSESSERAGTRLRRLGQEVLTPVGDKANLLGQAIWGNAYSWVELGKRYREFAKNDPVGLMRTLAVRMKEGGAGADILNSSLSTVSRQALVGLGQNLKGLNRNLKTSEQAYKRNTSLQREFAAQSKTLNNQIQLVKNNITNVAISIGNVLIPPLTKLLRLLSPLLAKFGEWLDKGNAVTLIIGSLTAAAVALVPAISMAVGAIGGLSGVATLAGTALAALTSPISLVIMAVGALAIAWNKDFAGIRTQTLRLVNVVKKEFGPVFKQAKAVILPIIEALSVGWHNFGWLISKRVGFIVAAIVTKLIPVIKKLADITSGALSAIDAWWQRHGAFITSIVQSVYKSLWTYVDQGLVLITRVIEGRTDKIALAFNTLKATAISDFKALGKMLPAPIKRAFKQIGTELDSLQKQTESSVKSVIIPIWNQHKDVIIRDSNKVITKLKGLGGQLGILDKQGKVTKYGLAKVGLALVGLITPVGQVGSAILTLNNVWKRNLFGIRDNTKGALSVVRNVTYNTLTSLNAWWNTTGKKIVNTVVTNFNKVRSVVSSVLNFIWKNLVKPILRNIQQLWALHGKTIKRELAETWAAISKNLDVVFRGIKIAIKLTLKAISLTIKGFTQGAKFVWNHWGREIKAIAKVIFDAIASIIGGVLDTILTLFEVTLDVIQGDWSGAFNKLRKLTERILGGIWNFIKKWADKFAHYMGEKAKAAKDAFLGALGKLKNKISGMMSDFRNAGKGLVNAFTKGIKSLANKPVKAVKGIVSKVRKYLPGSDAEKGPLSDLTKSGKALPETFAKGMARGNRAVEDMTVGVASSATPSSSSGTVVQGGNTYNLTIHANDANGVRSAGNDLLRELRSHNVNKN